jgi:hypothetical protein
MSRRERRAGRPRSSVRRVRCALTAFDSREPEVIIRTVLTALRAAFAVYYLERFPGDVEALNELLGSQHRHHAGLP